MMVLVKIENKIEKKNIETFYNVTDESIRLDIDVTKEDFKTIYDMCIKLDVNNFFTCDGSSMTIAFCELPDMLHVKYKFQQIIDKYKKGV